MRPLRRGCSSRTIRRTGLFYEVYDKEQSWLEHRKAAHFLAFMEVGNRAIVTRDVTKLTGVNVKS